MTFLKVDNIHTYIDQFHILQGVSFEAKKGEATVLLGRNGAGKTTSLRSIMGLNRVRSGSIIFKDEDISAFPTYAIAQKGIGYVPENQGIFGGMTVKENLEIAVKKKTEETAERLEWMLELFPDLKTFYHQKGGRLSGGQKQMLAIARAYLNNNDLLLIDEPSKGLAPVVIEKVIETVNQLKGKTTVVLVEQNFMMASAIGDRFYIIDEGKTVHNGAMQELREDKDLRQKYLGIA
ncbi:MAG: ABC transporter ATP-binding protein [Tuberibacillus sp.]